MKKVEKFLKHIARLELGSAPSAGYFEQIILEAREAKEEFESLSETSVSRISDIKEVQKEKNRIEGILLGLKICKEMLGQGSISHENIYEKEIYYKEEFSKLQNRTA